MGGQLKTTVLQDSMLNFKTQQFLIDFPAKLKYFNCKNRSVTLPKSKQYNISFKSH